MRIAKSTFNPSEAAALLRVAAESGDPDEFVLAGLSMLHDVVDQTDSPSAAHEHWCNRRRVVWLSCCCASHDISPEKNLQIEAAIDLTLL